MDPLKIFGELISKAIFCEVMIAYPHPLRLKHALREGRPVPPECRPGALLEQLSYNEREALKRLTSDKVRKYGWIDYHRYPGMNN